MGGLLTAKDIFNSKFITAEISDSAHRLWFVHIKYVIGDYFTALLDNQLYCFKINSRIKTYRHRGVKSFRVLQYDTTHYLPISGEDLTNLEKVLRENGLPKVSGRLHSTFKYLGNREKQKFEPHDIQQLIDKIGEKEDEYGENVRNLQKFLASLGMDKIITPVKRLAEFLDDDLKTTDPKFLGGLLDSYEQLDFEHKKITNTPITGRNVIWKVILIIMIAGLAIGIGYWVWSSGILTTGLGGFGFDSFTGGQTESQKLMQAYPTPEALNAAIDRNEVNYETLPPDIKRLVDEYRKPVFQPTP